MSANGGDEGALNLSVLDVGLASLALLINVAISFHQNLGLHTQLLVAAARMVLQLSALGLILVPIFRSDRWWMVGSYVLFMVGVASLEAAQRPSHTYKGMLSHVLMATGIASTGLLAYTVLLVLGLRPIWDAQYLIPIAGMILGNATSGVSVGLSTVLEEFASRKDGIELLLSLGASRAEATQALVQRSVRTALMPFINQMAVMGLVSIPGMMTGQILAGSDPSKAARYQMVIMFMIGSSSVLAATGSVYLAVSHLVDEKHALRPDRLGKKMSLRDTWAALVARIRKAGSALHDLCCTCLCCVLPASIAPAQRHRRTGSSGRGGSAGGRGGPGMGLGTAAAWSSLSEVASPTYPSPRGGFEGQPEKEPLLLSPSGSAMAQEGPGSSAGSEQLAGSSTSGAGTGPGFGALRGADEVGVFFSGIGAGQGHTRGPGASEQIPGRGRVDVEEELEYGSARSGSVITGSLPGTLGSGGALAKS